MQREFLFFGERARLVLLLATISVFLLSTLLVLPGEVFALSITNATVSEVTSTSAKIAWTTDVPADSEVAYIPFNADSSAVPKYVTDDTLSTSHNFVITGLTPGTKYTIAGSSADADGVLAYTQDMYFDTLANTSQGQATTTTTSTTTNSSQTTNTTQSSTTGSGLQYSDLATQQANTGLQYSDLFSEQEFFDNAPKEQAKTATDQELQVAGTHPTGTLGAENGTVYFLMKKDGVKIPFTSWEAFVGLGFTQNMIRTDISLASYRTALTYKLSSITQEHPWGSCLKWKDGTVFYHHSTGMIGVPDMLTLASIGCTVVDMNSADEKIWETNQSLPVYVINDARRL